MLRIFPEGKTFGTGSAYAVTKIFCPYGFESRWAHQFFAVQKIRAFEQWILEQWTMRRMRSTGLISVFVLACRQFFAPQKIRALEQWRSGAVGGATMRSNVPLFNLSGLQEPAFAGFFVGA